jgi:uncharacterized protein DUF6265
MVTMRRILAAALVVGLAAAPGIASPPVPFPWLSGHWQALSGGGWTEEIWSPMRGGQMVGAGHSGQGDRPSGFEHMRIVREGDSYVFYGSPNGAAATGFRQVEGGPDCRQRRCMVAFENRAHDYPKRIVYQYRFDRKNELVATISGADPATDSRSWTYERAP